MAQEQEKSPTQTSTAPSPGPSSDEAKPSGGSGPQEGQEQEAKAFWSEVSRIVNGLLDQRVKPLDSKLDWIIDSIKQGAPANPQESPQTEPGQGAGAKAVVKEDNMGKAMSFLDKLLEVSETDLGKRLTQKFLGGSSPGASITGHVRLGRALTPREFFAWMRWSAQAFKSIPNISQEGIDQIMAASPEEAMSAVRLGIEVARAGGSPAILNMPQAVSSEPPAPTMGRHMPPTPPRAPQ